MIEELINAVQNLPKGIREGQALMNKLHELNPELYNKISGTDSDPFYLDSRIPKFWEKIDENSKSPF